MAQPYFYSVVELLCSVFSCYFTLFPTVTFLNGNHGFRKLKSFYGLLKVEFFPWHFLPNGIGRLSGPRVSIIGCVRSFVTKGAATLVHNTLILPLYDYCDIAWSNLLQRDIDQLQYPQNRSAWIITHCSHSSEAIEQLHWPTLSSRCSDHIRLNSFFSVFTH